MLAVVSTYFPTGQSRQVLETESCWYLPTSQLMQELDEVCPVKGWYLPTPQAGQSPAELWLFAFCPPSGLYRPVGQFLQLVWPVASWYCPWPQMGHELEPAEDWLRPTAQLMQSLALSW